MLFAFAQHLQATMAMTMTTRIQDGSNMCYVCGPAGMSDGVMTPVVSSSASLICSALIPLLSTDFTFLRLSIAIIISSSLVNSGM